MHYEIVQREEDDYIKFYVATRDDGTIFEIPCIIVNDEVDIEATKNKMNLHINKIDELTSYLKK